MTPEQLHAIATQAAIAAFHNAKPQAMIVGHAANVFSNDIDTSREVYIVNDGVCGFAEVRMKGTTAFGRWAKKSGIARKSYTGGLRMGVPMFSQSLARNEAYAEAYAKTLRDHGVTDAWADSRID